MDALGQWQPLMALVGAAIGVIGSLYAAFGSTSRRLRKDLKDDTQLLDNIRGQVRVELREQIDRRVYLLVATTKYPSITLVEVLLVLLLALPFFFLLRSPGDLRELAELGDRPLELSGPGQLMVALVAVGIFAAITDSWAKRAARRTEYVYDRLGDDEARNLVRALVFPAYIGPVVFGLGLSLSLIWNLVAIQEVYHLGDWVILLAGVVLLAAMVGVSVIVRRTTLSDYVRFYTDPLWITSDLPVLRPARLGRTQTDLDEFSAAWKERGRRSRRGR